MIKVSSRRGAAIAAALAVVVAATVASGAFGSVKSATAAKHNAKSPATLVVGGIFPFTGTKSLLSQWGTHGVPVGIYEVNHNGGVLGHKWKSAYVDDAADSVDALPAFRKLLLKHPTLIVGPFSPTIEAVINQFKPNNVADFMVEHGLMKPSDVPPLDKMYTDKFVGH